jgi:hypothetical protein
MRAAITILLAAVVPGCQPASQPRPVAIENAGTVEADHRLPDLARTSTAQSDRIDKAELDRKVVALLREYGDGIATSLWVGSDSRTPLYEWNSSIARPAASAIKTFHLVELFAAFAGKLDEPLPGADRVLSDANHRAMAVFVDRNEQEEIRQVLSGASVRQIGMVMMRQRTLDGEKVKNCVYNAAANLVTAVLGGPEALTTLIHKRDRSFETMRVRRYMLADRKAGDNDASAAALAALYGRLATRKLAGIDDRTMGAIHESLLYERIAPNAALFCKDGLLNSPPLTSVRAGWWEKPSGPVVYVVMLVQTGSAGPDLTFDRIHDTSKNLAALALDNAAQAARK